MSIPSYFYFSNNILFDFPSSGLIFLYGRLPFFDAPLVAVKNFEQLAADAAGTSRSSRYSTRNLSSIQLVIAAYAQCLNVWSSGIRIGMGAAKGSAGKGDELEAAGVLDTETFGTGLTSLDTDIIPHGFRFHSWVNERGLVAMYQGCQNFTKIMPDCVGANYTEFLLTEPTDAGFTLPDGEYILSRDEFKGDSSTKWETPDPGWDGNISAVFSRLNYSYKSIVAKQRVAASLLLFSAKLFDRLQIAAENLHGTIVGTSIEQETYQQALSNIFAETLPRAIISLGFIISICFNR